MRKFCTTLSLLCLTLGAVHAQQADPPVDPKAVEIAQRASDFLAGQKHFQVTAEIWDDVTIEGKRLQFSRSTQVSVRRPDRALLAVRTTQPTRTFYYNGKTLTVADHKNGFYAETDAAGTIDETVALVDRKLGLQFPLQDILLSKPFGDAAAKVLSAQYLGVERILGTDCHHVAFQNSGIHWQAWIKSGPVPTVRKAVMVDADSDDASAITILFEDDRQHLRRRGIVGAGQIDR